MADELKPQKPTEQKSASGVTQGRDQAEAKGASDAKTLAKGAAVAGTAAAAPAAGQALGIYMFLMWLKQMLMALLAGLLNLVTAFIGMILGMVSSVVAGFMAVGAAISAFVGGAISAAVGAITTAGAVATVGLLVVSGVVTVVNTNTAMRTDDSLDSVAGQCAAKVSKTVQAGEDSAAGLDPTQVQAKALDNAKVSYSVLAGVGMSDENVSGVLGNWYHESLIDPTGVETIYSEPHTIGPKKKAAEEADFVAGKVLPADYANKYPNIKYVGIGLGQWTNERNRMLLSYAKDKGQPWHDIKLQLSFMLQGDDSMRINQIRRMVDQPMGVDEATTYFMNNWEGINNGTLGERQTAAAKLFSMMGDWEKDESYKSLLDQAHNTTIEANNASVEKASESCSESSGGKAGMYDGDLGDGEWTNPCPDCKYFTSNYGFRKAVGLDAANGGVHHGIDIASRPAAFDNGAPLVAVDELEIIDIYNVDGCVIAKQVAEPGFYFNYCHAREIKVKVGDVVPRGTILATESNLGGNIPQEFMTHLHFEIYKPGATPDEVRGKWFNVPWKFCNVLDPEDILKQKGIELAEVSWPSRPVPSAYKAAQGGAC